MADTTHGVPDEDKVPDHVIPVDIWRQIEADAEAAVHEGQGDSADPEQED